MTACDPLELEILPPYIGSAVSPTVDITETTDDITVTITDFRGEHAYTVDKTDQAIADAEQAATNANTAAASANQAAQAATAAAGTANTAAQNADAKAALADSKASLANTAATTANTAAQAAEAAKTAANTAAGQATTAASNADAKAALADTAAANADTATQAANTATTNATNAAQAANNAADVAIEAAEDMPRLIGTVDTVQTVADAWPTTIDSATVYGKCVQDGTPTPSAPVPVQVVSGTVNITINGTATPIDLHGHTLAGGDVLKVDSAGRVWIEDGSNVADLASYTWSWQAGWQSWYTPYIPELKGSGNTGIPADMTCTNYPAKSQSHMTSSFQTDPGIGAVGGASTGWRIVVKNGSTTDTPTGTLYYQTIEHQTIELGTITPPEIAPGDTIAMYASLDPDWQIEYTQDPSIVVNTLQSSIAPVEGATASTNYAVGAYLMHGNQLYRVTSAIATGEAITPGSNCVACTVMGEVIRLTA